MCPLSTLCGRVDSDGASTTVPPSSTLPFRTCRARACRLRRVYSCRVNVSSIHASGISFLKLNLTKNTISTGKLRVTRTDLTRAGRCRVTKPTGTGAGPCRVTSAPPHSSSRVYCMGRPSDGQSFRILPCTKTVSGDIRRMSSRFHSSSRFCTRSV